MNIKIIVRWKNFTAVRKIHQDIIQRFLEYLRNKAQLIIYIRENFSTTPSEPTPTLLAALKFNYIFSIKTTRNYKHIIVERRSLFRPVSRRTPKI